MKSNFGGYLMRARLDRGAVRLLTRTGLDRTSKYPAIAAAVAALRATGHISTVTVRRPIRRYHRPA